MKPHNKNNPDAPLWADLDDARSGVLRPKPAPPLLRNVCAVLASVGIGFYLLAGHLDLRQLLGHRPPDYHAGNSFTQNQQILPYRELGGVPLDTQAQKNHSTPLSLDECIKPGNVIDQNVLTCRYGEHPAPINLTHNMVSPEYLAQYKADQNRRIQHPRLSLQGSSDQAMVRQWDGAGAYLAQWNIYANRIDGSSVCANHRSGSIPYRECRKGAHGANAGKTGGRI